MKRIIGILWIIISIALAFVIDKYCTANNFNGPVQISFLATLFIYFLCWSALSVLEKTRPSYFSVVGTNVGMGLFLTCIVVAFINITWWIVLISLPLIWFIAGFIGGKLARRFSHPAVFFLVAFFCLSFMFHIFYTTNISSSASSLIVVGVFFLSFFTYGYYSPRESSAAQNEYLAVNGRNYYLELHDEDMIGRIDAPGFKQTYDRIIAGVLTQIVRTKNDFQRFGSLLYSKNFYPLSNHTKNDVMQHINSVIAEVSRTSKDGNNIREKATSNLELLFNTYVSVMSIHEEATREIEEIETERNKFHSGI